MKIAIDVQTTLGRPTGFGFYVSNLVANLEKRLGEDELVLIHPKSEADFSTPRRFLWDQFTLARLAVKAGADILHQPCFSAPFIFPAPTVVTVHDIISILFPENIPFASRMFYSKWMPFSYRRAKRVITISESTKRDIVKVLKIPENKIKVIHLGAEEKFRERQSPKRIEQVRKKYHLPEEYILHVGTLEPRKNLGFLIEAFSKVILSKPGQNLYLVIVGKKGWYYEGLFEKTKQLKLENRVIFTGYVDEDDKAALYQGAKIFAFPSLYEGFGLPPLEAMCSRVPVITSNTSSMPEVIGEAGILLSPSDKNGWVRAIERVARDRNLREKMKAKGLKQADKFSWEQTARQTVAVYGEAVRK